MSNQVSNAIVYDANGVLISKPLLTVETSGPGSVDPGDISLASAKIIVGNASNVGAAVSMSGAATISNAGVVSLTSTSVTSALLTNYSSGAGTLSASDSILQGFNKLNGNIGLKAPLDAPVFTTSLTTPVTANRALATGTAGLLVASATTDTELGYVHGVTSAIQTQLDAKAPTASPTFSGTATLNNASNSELDITGGANAVLRSLGGSGTVMYFGEISSHRGMFDGTATPLLIDGGSGNVVCGGTTGVASAQLAVTSTTQGFLLPRMTTTQKNAISSPAEGLMVYDTTLHKLSVFTGTVWETVTSA